jgi:hypothetical protein
MTPSNAQQPLPQLPTSTPVPPVFGSNLTPRKAGPKSPIPTFLGAGSMPTKSQTPGKQLVGQ